MAIDPNLLVIKPINEIQTASDPLSGQVLIYDGGNELKKASLQGIKDSVSSGIKGEATPSTVPTPWTSGQPDLYEKYDVKVAGTFTNFKDSGNNPLVITTDDLSNNFVQIWIKNGVAKRVLKAIPTPPVIGVVVEGNTQAVSGGEVYDAINGITTITPINLSTPSPEQNGIFQPTEAGVYERFGGLELTEEELENNIVYFYYLDGIFTKQTKGVLTLDEVTPEGTNAVNGKAVFDYTNKTINTIADLRLFNGKEGQIITLLGYYEAGDKEPLNYKYTSTQSVDDGGSIINTSSGSWIALFENKVNVLDFGVNDGASLKSKFNSILNICKNNKLKLFFEKNKTYDLSSGISFVLDNGIYIDLNGSTLVIDNSLNSTVFFGEKKSGIEIKNGSIKGLSNEGATKVFGCRFWSCNDVLLTNITFSDLNMDGVYIGKSSSDTSGSNGITIENCRFTDLGRQGISVTFGRNINIHYNYFNNIIGDPGAAVDIEPNNINDVYSNVNISNNTVINCSIGFMLSGVSNDIGSYDNKNIIITNNIIYNTSDSVPMANGREILGIISFASNVLITNNIIYGVQRGLYVGWGDRITISSNQISVDYYNNVIDKNIGRCIHFRNGMNINVIDNIINNGESERCVAFFHSNFENVCIRGNSFNKTTNSAIFLASANLNFTNLSIEGNSFTNFNVARNPASYPNASIIHLGYFNINGHLSIKNNKVINTLGINNVTSFIWIRNSVLINYMSVLCNDLFQSGISKFINSTGTIDNDNIYLNILNSGVVNGESTIDYYGLVKKSSSVTNVTTADATDLATALVLVNELKAKLNAKLTADRNSGQQAT